MSNKMKAAVLFKPKDIRINFVVKPFCRSNEILIKTKRVGVCASDVRYYNRGRIGSAIVKYPFILGHECSGQIYQIGDNVQRSDLIAGKRVIIEPGFFCGKCQWCIEGKYNLCSSINFYGCPPFNGSFSEYIVAPEENVYCLPDNMTFEEGAMIEPLAVGITASKMGFARISDIILIMGAGPIGQMTLQACRVRGISEIYVTDILDYRLRYAVKYGAENVFNVEEENVQNKIKKLTKGKGVDVIIETSGSENAIREALEIIKPGGRIILVGHPPNLVNIPLEKLIRKEILLQGIHRYRNVFETAINTVKTRQISVKPFVTHIFQLEKIHSAFETYITKKGNPMKIQISL